MSDPVAVVVGLCAHGLAISRSLNFAGKSVVAIEANRNLPGTKTVSSTVVYVDDINGEGLIDALVEIAPTVSSSGTPILYLTNDTMVATVGKHYESIGRLYKLSWGSARNVVVPLLRKKEIEERCKRLELRHPITKIFDRRNELTPNTIGLAFPIIFKPDRPVSSYKTLVVESNEQLTILIPRIESALPAIAQEFIPGSDSDIYFAALYLADGDVLARFEGRKLRSRPMGHTTIAISESNNETHALARRFFGGLNMSGPVSLELKRAPDHSYWIIEPTVGRTDFWVGLCIHDGINLPMIEYNSQLGTMDAMGAVQQNKTLWINGERDPAALAWIIRRYPWHLLHRRIVGVYIDSSDLLPFGSWAINYLVALPGRIISRFLKIVRRAKSGENH